MIAATEDIVVTKILSCGCKRRPDLDKDRAFCFEDSFEKLFFITKTIDGVGYTSGQLEAIEDSLRNRAIDLFPLDPWLM